MDHFTVCRTHLCLWGFRDELSVCAAQRHATVDPALAAFEKQNETK